LRLNLGFNPRSVISMSVDLALDGYDQPRGQQLQMNLLGRLQELPNVQAAGLINALPLTADQSSTRIGVEGQPQRSNNCVNYYHAAPGYFRTMETQIVAGRDFELSDGVASKPVAIVNRALARRVFGTEDVLGKRIGFPNRWREIVGIVDDGRYSSLGD